MKSCDLRAIFAYSMLFFAKNHFPTQNLFTDAEAAEDCAEDLVGGDFAGDFAEVVHCFANVLAHEVAADAVV